MQRTGPTKGHEDEGARVVATLHGNQTHGADHVGIGDLHDAMRRLQGVESQGLGTLPHDGHTTGVWVKRDFPAQEKRRVEPAQQQIGIGDGRCRATLAVTDRTRHRPGAAWPHAQGPTGIDPGFTPAPCPNFNQVNHRRAHWITTAAPFAERRDRLSADLELCGQL